VHRVRRTWKRNSGRGIGVLGLVLVALYTGETSVFADCGNTAAAMLTGSWQMRETVTSYTGGTPDSSNKPVGFQGNDTIQFVSTCTAPGNCTITIPGNAAGNGFQFFSANGLSFAGPVNTTPLVQSGSTITDTYVPSGGFGGPNLPQCNPPPNYNRATLTLQIAAAMLDPAGGGWRATLLTGEYQTAIATFWRCQGGVGVIGAVEHLSIEAVPVGSSFPAQITPNCAPPATPSATAAATPVPVPHTLTPGGQVNPNESSIAATLSTPADAFSSPTQSIINALITLAIILFITFPSQLFNRTFEENYDEIRAIAARRLGWLARLRFRVVRGSSGARSAIVFALVLLVGAVLGGLNDPEFGFNTRSAATYLAVVLAILTGVAVSTAVNLIYRRVRKRDSAWSFHALPAGLVVAGACVVISRVTQFQPGYLYGLIVGIAFGGSLAKNEEGHSVALGAIASLVVAVLAWFAWLQLHAAAAEPGAAFGTVFGADFFASIFVGGLVGSVIGLFPLRFLPGSTLAQWSRVAWAVIFGLATFGLLEVMLRPQSTAAHPGNAPLVTAIVLFVIFGGLSVGFRGYFSVRKRRAEGRA
jgi:hypothetical protein